VESSGAELLRAAERVYNVERAFIVREGARRRDDYPPEREFTDPLPEGRWPRLPGGVLDRALFDRLLTAYYQAHGWDAQDGVPLRAKLVELGLSDVADVLAARGLAAESAGA
jgi:aldehyde:ferredoxin oxidoreductase